MPHQLLHYWHQRASVKKHRQLIFLHCTLFLPFLKLMQPFRNNRENPSKVLNKKIEHRGRIHLLLSERCTSSVNWIRRLHQLDKFLGHLSCDSQTTGSFCLRRLRFHNSFCTLHANDIFDISFGHPSYSCTPFTWQRLPYYNWAKSLTLIQRNSPAAIKSLTTLSGKTLWVSSIDKTATALYL